MKETARIQYLAKRLYRELAKQGYKVTGDVNQPGGPLTSVNMFYDNETGILELDNIRDRWKITCGVPFEEFK